MKKDPSIVPERYIIRSGEVVQRCVDTNTNPFSSDIPLIDFSLPLEGQEDELKKLDEACKEWGFFQVTQMTLQILCNFFCNVFQVSTRILIISVTLLFNH